MQTLDKAQDPESTRTALQVLNEMQARALIGVYNMMSEKCFQACVRSFDSPKLADREEVCVTRCVEKFQNYSLRAQRAFAKANISDEELHEILKAEEHRLSAG